MRMTIKGVSDRSSSIAIKVLFIAERPIMARLSWFQKMYWRHLAKPVENRALYNYVIENPIASILEIGIGNGERIRQVLALSSLKSGCSQLRYVGVDLFESAADQEGHLRLKDAHRMLAERACKAHLFPGDATNSLQRVSQTVLPSDLIIIDEGWQESSAAGESLQGWHPRLVHAQSVVFARSKRSEKLMLVAVEPSQAMPVHQAA